MRGEDRDLGHDKQRVEEGLKQEKLEKSNPDKLENPSEKPPLLQQPQPQKFPGAMSMKQSQSVSFSDSDQDKVRRFTISSQPSNVNLAQPNQRKPSLQSGNSGQVVAPPLHQLPSQQNQNPQMQQQHSQQQQQQQQSHQQQQSYQQLQSQQLQQLQQLQQYPQSSQPKSQDSSTHSSRNNSTVNSDFLSFLTSNTPKNPIPSQPALSTTHAFITSSNNSSRVNSPSSEYPPNFKSIYSFDQKKKDTSYFSPSPPPFLEKATSPTPVNISRKNSLKKQSNKTIIESPVGPPVPFQQYLSRGDDGKIHVLIGCTGSVATIKIPLIIDKLFQIFGKSKINIQLVITKSANHFLKGLKIHNDVKIWRDEDEWANFSEQMDYFHNKKKNPYEKLILHNELRKWADIMLLAPLSANTLAKITNGISDNLLTSIIRSWGWSSSFPASSASSNSGTTPPPIVKKPILVAPAMNTFMYTHPLTKKQLQLLESNEYGFGMEILKPVEKVLICGDIGMGGMREWSDIVDILRRRINSIKNLEEDKVIDEEEDEDEDDEEEDDDDDDDDDDEDDEEEDDDDDDDDDTDTDSKSKTDIKHNDNDEMMFQISEQK